MINFAPKIYFGMETRLEIIMMEEAKKLPRQRE